MAALEPWWAQEERPPIGLRPRHSWRELPQTGPSHLFLEPNQDHAVGSLLESITRGYYLIDGEVTRFAPREDRLVFEGPGFEIHRGRVVGPVRRVRFEWSLVGFWPSVQAVARDLVFVPVRGAVGCPSLLARSDS